jgi:hypothetical protein
MSANTSLILGLSALGVLIIATMSDSPTEKQTPIKTDSKKPKVEPKKVVL